MPFLLTVSHSLWYRFIWFLSEWTWSDSSVFQFIFQVELAVRISWSTKESVVREKVRQSWSGDTWILIQILIQILIFGHLSFELIIDRKTRNVQLLPWLCDLLTVEWASLNSVI